MCPIRESVGAFKPYLGPTCTRDEVTESHIPGKISEDLEKGMGALLSCESKILMLLKC